MRVIQPAASVIDVETHKVTGSTSKSLIDSLSVEEPLEMQITADIDGCRRTESIAVTMRTPGDDRELAAGFLFTEGIIEGIDDIEGISDAKCNTVRAILREGVEVDSAIFERHSFVASSCGVCGKKSIAAIRVRRNYETTPGEPLLAAEIIHTLPEKLRSAQSSFASTGGIHASGLFDTTGTLLSIREDVGRHNALDKLIGSELLRGKLPLSQQIVMVSGRASFELVQKAAHAGVPILAAVGAPSSLAVQLAEECGMTLLGFVRDNRFNVYAGNQRVVVRSEAHQVGLS